LSVPIQLIVGLGNPGGEYHQTRHNAGALWVQSLADNAGALLLSESKFHGLTSKITLASISCQLLIPTTYMNASGRAVLAMVQYYKIPPQAILVAHDEIDLPMGTVRLKQAGGHGGHNGLRDIIDCLGTQDFLRLRLGISHPGQKSKVADYVLGRLRNNELQQLDQVSAQVAAILPSLMRGDINAAQKQLHTSEEK
jgi:peptidyl-tRNA hydrolase, PTH1 family